jgi:hypothetical protein
LLRMEEAPEVGGDTQWVSTCRSESVCQLSLRRFRNMDSMMH